MRGKAEVDRHSGDQARARVGVAHECTEVEVLFEPSPTGTLVTVTHRGWAALRGDHPVRHGQEVVRFIGEMGRWWGGLLSSYRVTVHFRGPDPL